VCSKHTWQNARLRLEEKGRGFTSYSRLRQIRAVTEQERLAIAEEQGRLDRLRRVVDIAAAVVRCYPLSRCEAVAVVRSLRTQVLLLFPDKADTFDLIYGRRFRRLIEDRFGRE